MADLEFTPPGPGIWELEQTHFSRPATRTRYASSIFPRALSKGFGEGTRRYGLLLDSTRKSFVKTTALTETKSLQFRAEAFNVFNRANFNRPGPLTESIRLFNASGGVVPSAATIRSTLTDSRQIQFGLKITF
jgi:hypothetical protein